MRDLYLQVENDARVRAPAYLLEKAYRWADRVSLRMNRERVARSAAPASVRAAIQELEAVSRWCDELAKVTETVSARPGNSRQTPRELIRITTSGGLDARR